MASDVNTPNLVSTEELSLVWSECNICAQLRSLFEENSEGKSELTFNNPDELLQSTTCPVHPILIKAAFNVDVKSGKFDELVSHHVQGRLSFMAVHKPVHAVQISRSAVNSGTITLLPGASDNYLVRGREVDASRIDSSLLRDWKERCRDLHGEHCINPLLGDRYIHSPAFLIDCWENCLVVGSRSKSYLALSYVWGKADFLKAKKDNLSQLLHPFSLTDPNLQASIPNTISDAIKLVKILKERYLWVDALCIVQDEESAKHAEMLNMASIYGNASITIVACGKDVHSGLCGLSMSLIPRRLVQPRFRLGNGVEATVVRSHMDGDTDSHPLVSVNHWKTRAWTFQEGLFSNRKIVFHNGTVRWECGRDRWFEDLVYEGKKQERDYYADEQMWLPNRAPSLTSVGSLIQEYNVRDLAYPEDAHHSIAGTLQSLGASFPGGFLSGLPVFFFDIALLWQPKLGIKERAPRTKVLHPIPSWSWLAYKGSINTIWWGLGQEYVKDRAYRLDRFEAARIEPLVQWSYKHSRTSSPVRLGLQWYHYRRLYQNKKNHALPTGWKRHRFDPRNDRVSIMLSNPSQPPKFYFEHTTHPSCCAWYPIPLNEKAVAPILVPLITCRTRRAWLYAAEAIQSHRSTFQPPELYDPELIVSIRNSAAKWAGVLLPHASGKNPMNGQTLELVEISKGYIAIHNGILEEWDHPERPKEPIYAYTNVLWIVWSKDIAYRNGIGRIENASWESASPSWCDLVLG